MKKIIVTTIVAGLVAIALAGCWGKNKPSGKLLDKNAMLYINVTDGKTRAENPDLPHNPEHLSPVELVKQAENMIFINSDNLEETMWLGGIIKEGEYLTTQGRKAGEYQYKLVDQAKFVFWGDFIIGKHYKTNEPFLETHFFTAKDLAIYNKDGHIIGYIPQRVLKEAWKKIEKAFAEKDYDTVYKLFEEAYQAYPCTEEEWHELKAKGMN